LSAKLDSDSRANIADVRFIVRMFIRPNTNLDAIAAALLQHQLGQYDSKTTLDNFSRTYQKSYELHALKAFCQTADHTQFYSDFYNYIWREGTSTMKYNINETYGLIDYWLEEDALKYSPEYRGGGDFDPCTVLKKKYSSQ